MTVREVPSDYRPRVGESKLQTLPDGWRHLRMLMILSPHLVLLAPGLLALALGLALSAVSLFAPQGVPIGMLRWLPVFMGPMLLILGAQAALLGALAAARSELTPDGVRARLRIFREAGGVDVLLRRFSLLAALGIVLDGGLFVAWLLGVSGSSLK